MSNHQYISNSSSLFAEEDDIDEQFLNSRPKNVSKPTYGASGSQYGGTMADLDQHRQTLLERQREIEQRTLDSSARSIGLLRDSEQIGISTAEELMRQREQLENTNKRLDEINTNLRFSQKHINGIKSVFSSLKNYISGKNEQPNPRNAATPSENTVSSSGLSEIYEQRQPSDAFNNHPSTRLRGYNDNDNQRQKYTGHSSESKRVDELLDANLDEMAGAISRLKGLGTQLGEEILTQNELIDTIQDKVEVADMTIGKQNKQMNKLLGK